MDTKFLLWVLGYGYRVTLVYEHLEVLLCNENHFEAHPTHFVVMKFYFKSTYSVILKGNK